MVRRQKINPRIGQNLKRRKYLYEVKHSFLIVCEGKNTEPDYFSAFRLTSASVNILGEGLNTMGLVEKALRIKAEEHRKGHTYDQYWVVFDKDDFPDSDFNQAIKMAETNGLRVAYSNQAFELWFLLHYDFIQGPMHRSLYSMRLSKLLGYDYKKEGGFASRLYRDLLPLQPQPLTPPLWGGKHACATPTALA